MIFVFVLLSLAVTQITFPDLLNFLRPAHPSPVNRHATTLTRNLFANLRLAASNGFTMLGMDEATLRGEFARTSSCGNIDSSKLNGYDSDIREICDEGPGIYGFDFLQITGEWVDREPFRSDPNFTAESVHYSRVATRRLARSHIRKIHKRGGVSTIHWHMNNPIEEIPVTFNEGVMGQLWRIVPPSACWTYRLLWFAPHCGRAFSRFKAKVDDAVSFLNSLTVEAVEGENELDDQQIELLSSSIGIVNDPVYDLKNSTKHEYIPIIVRLFHEQNRHWFWWGVPKDVNNDLDSTAFRLWQVSYRVVWSWVVNYHNKHGRNNVLWATAPNSDFLTRDSYLQYAPSPHQLDVLGFDAYGDFQRSYPRTELRVVVRLAESLGKIPAATELGYNGGDRKAWPPNVWSGHLLGPALAERIAWVLMWHNAPTAGECSGTYWGPHIGRGDSDDFKKVCNWKDVIMEGGYDYFQTSFNKFTPSLRVNGEICANRRQHPCTGNGGRGYGRVWVCESGYFCADETPHSECKCRIVDTPRAENGLGFCLWNHGCGFGFRWPCSAVGSETACAKTDDMYTKACVSYCPNRPTCLTNNGRGQTSLFPCPENERNEGTTEDHTCARERLDPAMNETVMQQQVETFWDAINVFKSHHHPPENIGLCIVNDTHPPLAPNGFPYCIANMGCGFGDKWICGIDDDDNMLFCAKSDTEFLQLCVAFCPGTCPTPPLPCTARNGRGKGPLVPCQHIMEGLQPGLCVRNNNKWWKKPKKTKLEESGACECRVYGTPIASNGIPFCLTNRGRGYGWKRRCPMKTEVMRSLTTITTANGRDEGQMGQFDDDDEEYLCAYTDFTFQTLCVSVY